MMVSTRLGYILKGSETNEPTELYLECCKLAKVHFGSGWAVDNHSPPAAARSRKAARAHLTTLAKYFYLFCVVDM